jgi:hypothetical protein
MEDESLVTIRVSRELKQRMKKAGVNWSPELRGAIIEGKLPEAQRKEADAELERLLIQVKPGFDTTDAIKESRKRG